MTPKPVNTSRKWGGERTNISKLPDIRSESNLTDIQASCTNTDIITANGDRLIYDAAWTAKNYKPSGTPSGKNWCLPSAGLLKVALNNQDNFSKYNSAVYRIQAEAGSSAATLLGDVTNGGEYSWSSSEYDSENGWLFITVIRSLYSRLEPHPKDDRNPSKTVRPVMEF